MRSNLKIKSVKDQSTNPTIEFNFFEFNFFEFNTMESMYGMTVLFVLLKIYYFIINYQLVIRMLIVN